MIPPPIEPPQVVCAVPAPTYRFLNGGIALGSNFLELPTAIGSASWLGVGGQESPMVSLAPDMLEYLTYEAERRGISFGEVFAEESAARVIADAEAFSPEELAGLAANSKPNLQWLNGDEEYPF
jgi:hypothetical protein